jgi:hypothetical protein
LTTPDLRGDSVRYLLSICYCQYLARISLLDQTLWLTVLEARHAKLMWFFDRFHIPRILYKEGEGFFPIESAYPMERLNPS